MTADSAQRVLVTRPVGPGDSLVSLLRSAGFAPDHHPFIRLVHEQDEDLREAVEALGAGEFAWLVLTSAVAIDALDAYDGSAEVEGTRFTIPAGTRVAVVGKATAATLLERGYQADLIAHGSAASLVELMPPAAEGERALFLASSAAGPTIQSGLAERGYAVQRETAYRPEATGLDLDTVHALATGAYAAITLTSPMIATLAAQLPLHLSMKVVTIGAPTSEAAREAGLRVDVQAAEPTNAALVAAVKEALA